MKSPSDSRWSVDHILTRGCMRCPKGDTPQCKMIAWTVELQLLRRLILSCKLKETVKWGQACYTEQGKNVVLLHGFKSYCALLFFNGSTLNDPHALLVQQTQNVQTARQVRFTNRSQIINQKKQLTELIQSAKQMALKPVKKASSVKTEPLCHELELFFKKDEPFKSAFYKLTPGRQRAYHLFYNSAKQSNTRNQRILKTKSAIMQGLGIHDGYRNAKS